MSQTYDYNKTPVNVPRLQAEILADETIEKTLESGTYNVGETPNKLHITFDEALTSGEETALDTVVTDHNGTSLPTYTRYCGHCMTWFVSEGLSAPTTCPTCSSMDIISTADGGPKTYSFPMSEGGSGGYSRDQTGYMCYHLFSAVENNAKVPFPKGKATKIAIRVSTNSISTNDTTVTLRKNGMDTTLTFDIPADTTGLFSDSAHSVDIADGDELDFKIVIGLGTGVDGIYFKGGTVEMEVI